jgi:hypothetical protein
MDSAPLPKAKETYFFAGSKKFGLAKKDSVMLGISIRLHKRVQGLIFFESGLRSFSQIYSRKNSGILFFFFLGQFADAITILPAGKCPIFVLFCFFLLTTLDNSKR